ncbi:hypothetical protein [Helicobacter mehlei]|uniref:Uncharacterized protein n=1 Tax=Helicobacter mehlei TaxID=2316080 RepID=A0A553UT72_9HELI|nr:hypothetical protein [Helicobacter mehlei]TSA83191.1 hypothetical protein FNE76_05075 [Helicobacter mehlei]
MEKTIALASIYELQGLKEQALEIYKSVLTHNPQHKEALQGARRLESLVPHKRPSTPQTQTLTLEKKATLTQYAPLQHFQVQNMRTFFIQATSQAELQAIEEWLERWN